MTKRRVASLLVAVGILVALILWPREPSVAPPGQPALVTLYPSNLSDFEKDFDAHADQPRLVLLLSPT